MPTKQETAAALLDRHGRTYAEELKYQERTATMLGEMADRLLDEYGGDLRRLRDAADRDPAQERKLLKRFKGSA